MSKSFFITGIDTDTGKTVVTAGLLRYFRNRAINTMAMKPIQTGCAVVNGVQTIPDVDTYKTATKLDLAEDELKLIAPYRYEMASSPHLAAKEQKNYPSIEGINQAFNKLSSKYELTLIEGAGGILVPLDLNHTMLDLVKKLDIPTIIVVDNRLGMINHSLLTVATLNAAKIGCAGFIITNTSSIKDETDATIRQDNCQTISQMAKLPILAELPFIKNFNTTSSHTWNSVENVFEKSNLIEKLKVRI